MAKAEPKIAEGSSLHQFLDITPGYAPAWLCSRDSCLGFDILSMLEIGILMATFAIVKFYSGWAWAVGAPLFLFCSLLEGQFSKRERWGRARRRRIECVWCGREQTPAGEVCPTCQRRT